MDFPIFYVDSSKKYRIQLYLCPLFDNVYIDISVRLMRVIIVYKVHTHSFNLYTQSCVNSKHFLGGKINFFPPFSRHCIHVAEVGGWKSAFIRGEKLESYL